jgi:hypothetical protein
MAKVYSVKKLIKDQGMETCRAIAKTDSQSVRDQVWRTIYDVPNIPEWYDELHYELEQGSDVKYRVRGVDNERYKNLNRQIVWGVSNRLDVYEYLLDRYGRPIVEGSAEEDDSNYKNSAVTKALQEAGVKEDTQERVDFNKIKLRGAVLPKKSSWVRVPEPPQNITTKHLNSDREEGFAPGILVDNEGNRSSVYAIPHANLQKVPRAALVISTRKIKGFGGYSIMSWSLGWLRLQVIPYNPTRRYDATVILKIKDNTDFSQEIEKYIKFLANEIQGIPHVWDDDYQDEIGSWMFIDEITADLTTLGDPDSIDEIDIDEDNSESAKLVAGILANMSNKNKAPTLQAHDHNGRFTKKM